MTLRIRSWFVAFSAVVSSAAAQGTMSIESCNLACSSSGGGQVSCGLTLISVDRDIRVRFSRPVDPASLNSSTFSVVDVASGSAPTGALFVDPTDPHVAVFRPSMTPGGAIGFSFGFLPGHTYQIRIPGAAQGDPPPFVTSADFLPLENQTRMLCSVTTVNPPAGTGTSTCTPGLGGGPCPCAPPAGHHGCPNSVASVGASCYAYGHAELSHETLVLLGIQMPNSSALYFQGTDALAGGAGVIFGDGLRCAGGTVVRLRIVTNENLGSQVPMPGGTPISTLGGVTAPGTRIYQIWYRDPASFCTSATWNLTNGLVITWQL